MRSRLHDPQIRLQIGRDFHIHFVGRREAEFNPERAGHRERREILVIVVFREKVLGRNRFRIGRSQGGGQHQEKEGNTFHGSYSFLFIFSLICSASSRTSP